MAFKHCVLWFSGFLCLGWSVPALSQTHNFFPSEYPAHARLGIQDSRDSRTQWYYTDIFLPLYLRQDSILHGRRDLLLFFNPKIVSTDLSRDEQNLGIGARYLSEEPFSEEGIILGGNFFYDTKYSINGVRYHQLGAGLEFMHRWFDLRANYYRPLSGKKTVYIQHSFGERSLLRHLREEEPLRGCDLEVGVLLPGISGLWETRLFGGGYWYNATIGPDIAGKKIRLEITPSPLLSLTLELREDGVFGSDRLAGLRVSIPFDISRVATRKNPLTKNRKYLDSRRGGASLQQRMSDPIVRDLDIISIEKNTTTKVHDMIFVDNTYPDNISADGSLSHPYPSLTAAFSSPAYGEDIWVFVRQGDGTATGYTGSFTLADRSALWGEGCQYLGLGGKGFPLLDADGAEYALILGKDTIVMGLHIQNADKGIVGENSGSVIIHNNMFSSLGLPFGCGVSLSSSDAGTTSSAVITHNIIADNIANGIHITAKNFSTFNLTCSDNIIRNNALGSAIVFTTGDVLEDTSTINAAIERNTLTANSGHGISMQCNYASRLSTTISHNTITANNLSGIYARSLGDSALSAAVSRNTITDNSQHGISIDTGSGTLILDAGNGSLGSFGHNAIYGNGSGYHIYNRTTVIVKAEYNWWGKAPPESYRFYLGRADYDPWLTQPPD